MEILSYITAGELGDYYILICNESIILSIIVLFFTFLMYYYATKSKTVTKEEERMNLIKKCKTIGFCVIISLLIIFLVIKNYISICCGLIIESIIIVAFLSFTDAYTYDKRGKWSYRHRWNIVFISIILTISILGIYTMIEVFNDGKLYIHENTRFSTDIGDWGDFATCLAALFALISIYLAYRAFMGQVNASRRASFDATFTQIFAQHNTLRKRVTSYNSITKNIFIFITQNTQYSKDVFAMFREYYTNNKNKNVLAIWIFFNKHVIKENVSIDFNNYFKYIYHEVTIVTEQKEEVLDEKTKKKYIALIQAQMNNDELFCYLINQIYHYHKNNTEDEVKDYAKILKEYDFFKEICKYIGKDEKDIYTQHIENMLKDNTINKYIKDLIHDDH